MENLPKQFVVSRRPNEYLKQGPTHCGAYSVKGILSAYGLDTKTHPRDYHPGWMGRVIGATLGKNYYIKILRAHGLEAEVHAADARSDRERTHLLKSLLLRDAPVMIRIGNGYISDKYNPILGRFFGHWITLWGYDDALQCFFVYDSALPKKYWKNELPIGNTTRTYAEVLRDWRFGMWQPWSWIFVGKIGYLYIMIKGEGEKFTKL